MSSLASVALPDDLEWPDEWSWSPVSQAVSVSIGGSLIVEEQAQLAGRPITLRSNQAGDDYWALATLTTVQALQALANTARTQSCPMALTLPDGRTTTVLFRHGELGFEARPWKHIVPAEAADLYLITLRLQAVSAIVTPDP
jgi:hypothetical protein